MIYEHDDGMIFEISILRIFCFERKFSYLQFEGAKCFCFVGKRWYCMLETKFIFPNADLRLFDALRLKMQF